VVFDESVEYYQHNLWQRIRQLYHLHGLEENGETNLSQATAINENRALMQPRMARSFGLS
jgi:hypothetical protein